MAGRQVGDGAPVVQLTPGSSTTLVHSSPTSGRHSPPQSGVTGVPPTQVAVQSGAGTCTQALEANKRASNSTLNPVPVEARRRELKDRQGVRLRIASKKKPVASENVADEAKNLVRTPREESVPSANTPDAWHASTEEASVATPLPATITWHDYRRSSSSDRSESSDGVPRYQLPSVEERLRIIKEERIKRLEKMQEKVAMERAGTIAPRPATLIRVNQGRFKAIVGRQPPTANSSSAPLPIQERSADRSQAELPRRETSLVGCEVALEPRLPVVSPDKAQQAEEEEATAPLWIEKDE
ncbi:uncharacterized protein Tco025E_01448 [Trypanosoma conorhini]|uniref:Uncharacterized protein n=1 Tax=Trypanosoma conorhini TaxID=83891 RepID=A0A422Q8N6_9TRYP|nr:uncharacterized protein Tco025E_01448 [Trypanosoma conorhini]RNF26299.1 hypothetical protein Tco025E_01448 [Trypanosoma conorhini]